LIAIIAYFVIRTPYKKDFYPLKLEQEEEVVLKMKDWFNKEIKPRNYFTYYLHPFMPEALSFDPFNQEKVSELWGLYPAITTWGYSAIKDSTIVLWDAHYGHNEAQIPLEKIKGDPYFRMIKTFSPDIPFNVLNGIPFSINVFQKVDSLNLIADTLEKITIDFESVNYLNNKQSITDKTFYEGNHSAEYSSKNEFGPTLNLSTLALKNINSIISVSLECMIKSNTQTNSFAILSFHKSDRQTAYYSYPLDIIPTNNQWKPFLVTWQIDNKILKQSDEFKIYIWNKEKKQFWTDEWKITF